MKLHWDDSIAECGIYHLDIDNRTMCYLHEQAVYYADNKLHDWQLKELLEEGAYEFGACFDGCSHHHILTAKTLEEAKAEVIVWFTDYYKNSVKIAKEQIKYCKEMIKIFEEA